MVISSPVKPDPDIGSFKGSVSSQSVSDQVGFRSQFKHFLETVVDEQFDCLGLVTAKTPSSVWNQIGSVARYMNHIRLSESLEWCG